MEGIDDSNWKDYNDLCHDCFAAKFAIRKKRRIGYQNSAFDVLKETDKKRRGGQNVSVQEIKSSDIGRWVIDQNQLYTGFKKKDYKDPNFFKDKLRTEYNYVPSVSPKETNKQKEAREKLTVAQKKNKKIIE
eukprot:9532594-Ditylum_brightwellii.AAC.1